ncbi:hypothetical protein [Bifidobacterium gallicum]|nr:hypothetical protein [Bifidobacterium gallicum]KFI57856.1 hypothetical protein BGLCM_1271 [Bifidobacterium gallicum DSM 20093 = LMG 11596]
MTQLSDGSVEQIAAIPALREAAHAAAELMALWPLTKAEQLDNDAKYGEDLQVRITQMIAQVLCGQQISRADADFVYEGADSIPGVDQSVVEALAAANDAYDQMASYSDDHDVQLLFDADDMLAHSDAAHAAEVAWDDDTRQVIADFLSDAQTYVQTRVEADGHWLISLEQSVVAQRFALLVIVADMLLHAVSGIGKHLTAEIGGADDQRITTLARHAVPLVLVVNEFAEQLGLPRLCCKPERLHGVLAAYATPNSDTLASDSSRVLAEELAPLAVAEWHRHRDDVLWDAAEAKKRSREEDEAKSKAALAAKFAHVKDDPTKKTVEL